MKSEGLEQSGGEDGQRQATGPFRPHIVLLYCENAAVKGTPAISATAEAKEYSVRMEILPCSSKVEADHILKIVENGADGVEVVSCPAGKCRSLDGNVRAANRVGYAGKFLGQIGMGAERVGITQGVGLTTKALLEIAEKRASAVAPLGINPMKSGGIR